MPSPSTIKYLADHMNVVKSQVEHTSTNAAAQQTQFTDPRQTEELNSYSLKVIDELYKQGRPLPRVINNESLKNEMDLVNRIRMKQRAEAEKTGLNPPGGYLAASAQEE